MSKTERRVLEIFNQFLMTPRQMLCFNSQQLQSYRVAIGKLIENDLLAKASYKGAYCLTEAGYEAMKHLPKESAQRKSNPAKAPQLVESPNKLPRKHK